MADAEQSNLTMLTVDLLSAYVANNNVQHGDLSELIKSTHAALKVIDAPEAPAPTEPEHKPAVTARKSLGSRTHIISMIDGKPYQTLKRHLSKHGLTPQEYRERYSLPRDYPMVAPAYSESRRAIAERLGLGRKVTGAQTPATASAEEAVTAKAAPASKSAKAAVPATKAAASPAKTKTGAAPKAKPAKPAAKAEPVPALTVAQPAKQAPKPRTSGKAKGAAIKPTAAKPTPRKRSTKAAPRTEPAS
jgi:predicted transcriptional regulator